jgi:uncharacterized cupin superfamily protein
VLHGRPTLRTSGGERQLGPGDVVAFPVGPDGAHGLRNDTNEPARYVMVSTRRAPDVVEYPDLRKITACGPSLSQTGERLFVIHDVEDA